MYKHEITIRLSHTDAAGVVYFANLFTFAHECYEEFIAGWKPIGEIISQNELSIPIVHAEADYQKPMRSSEKITIEMQTTRIGNSSFELEYRFTDESKQTLAKAKTVHAVTDQKTCKPIEIPFALKDVLEEIKAK